IHPQAADFVLLLVAHERELKIDSQPPDIGAGGQGTSHGSGLFFEEADKPSALFGGFQHGNKSGGTVGQKLSPVVFAQSLRVKDEGEEGGFGHNPHFLHVRSEEHTSELQSRENLV